jgi:hypothetical protein
MSLLLTSDQMFASEVTEEKINMSLLFKSYTKGCKHYLPPL